MIDKKESFYKGYYSEDAVHGSEPGFEYYYAMECINRKNKEISRLKNDNEWLKFTLNKKYLVIDKLNIVIVVLSVVIIGLSYIIIRMKI